MIVLLISDQTLVRQALAALVQQMAPGVKIVHVKHLIDLDGQIRASGHPELVLLDMRITESQSVMGPHHVRQMLPMCKIAVIGQQGSATERAHCMDAGANIYIQPTSSLIHISKLLRELFAGIDRSEQPQLDPQQSAENILKLSKRQKQLLTLLNEGLSNRDIAERLGVSEHTVKVHFWRMYQRIGVNSRAKALHLARQSGWLS